MNVYDGIMQGLQEAVDYNNAKIKARSRTMSVDPVLKFEASEIKTIRTELGMTQYLFAGLMGVSTKTVEAWESGRNIPNGPASRILSMLQADPHLPEKYHIVTR